MAVVVPLIVTNLSQQSNVSKKASRKGGFRRIWVLVGWWAVETAFRSLLSADRYLAVYVSPAAGTEILRLRLRMPMGEKKIP